MHPNLQTLLTCLLILQFLVIVSHDLLNIPGWTHGSQVQSVVGRRKLVLATLINAVFPGAAVAMGLCHWNSINPPRMVANYWLAYCAVTVLSAVTMWYVPYFFGASPEKKRYYALMYAGTHQLLPPRGDNPRPNLLHLCFHVLFAITLALAIFLRFAAT